MVRAFPSRPETSPKFLWNQRPALHTYSKNWRFILSADGKSERRRTDREGKRLRAADEGWEKTISQMRAQIERQPLTTSCLGVTAQPHLSVCVPGWTVPKGQWLPAQSCVCAARLCTHTAADLRTHALASRPVFVRVPMRTSCLVSVSKLALSLRLIRWVNKCPGLPVRDMSW